MGIGYWIRVSAQGQGYVTESVRLLCKLAFITSAAQQVSIQCEAANTRSDYDQLQWINVAYKMQTGKALVISFGTPAIIKTACESLAFPRNVKS